MKFARLSFAVWLCLGTHGAAAEEPEGQTAEANSAVTAGPDRELARQLFSAGVSLARAGRYQAAKALFLEAYAAAPHYLVLYNIAQAELRLGESEAAVDHLRQFLQEGGAAVTAEKRAEVEAEIARLERDASRAEPARLPTATAPVAGPAVPEVGSGLSASPQQGRSHETPAILQPHDKESPRDVRVQPWAYAAIAGGLLALAGGGALYVWNDGRYQRWRHENEALEVLKQQTLASGVIPSEDAALSSRAHRNDQRLAGVKRVDPVPLVVGGAGCAAMALGLWELIGGSDGRIWRASADLSGFEIGAHWAW